MYDRSMKATTKFQYHLLFLLLEWLFWELLLVMCSKQKVSLVGDPGMRRDGLRVAFEAWNFCNEVGSEAHNMGSPRAADCFDSSDKLEQFSIHCVV